MLAVTPRPPVHGADAELPLILNTGRIRDQWHTMTRTGKAAKLLAHIDQPYLEIHPGDARRLGIADGALASVCSLRGEMLARVQTSDAQQPGSVFAPIHWNRQFTGQGRVGVLAEAVADPISGQPEFKQTPVQVTAYAATWHGFIMTRQALDCGAQSGYWARVRGKASWRHELAGIDADQDWPARMRGLTGLPGAWIDMQDRSLGRYRGALIEDGRLLAVYFLERDAARLPPRHWLESLFERDALNDAERSALLLGRPSQATPDCGRIVCACFGVGENTLKQAIAEGVDSVEALGLRLKAGSNCGSCIPELKRLLAAGAPADNT
jgi:assimilatory nitrate reductase catalytic subunit